MRKKKRKRNNEKGKEERNLHSHYQSKLDPSMIHQEDRFHVEESPRKKEYCFFFLQRPENCLYVEEMRSS